MVTCGTCGGPLRHINDICDTCLPNGIPSNAPPAETARYTGFAPCPCCDGLGEWDEGPLPASSGATEPDYRQVICPQCEGTGEAMVECEARTLGDLEDEDADGALDPDFLRDRQQDAEMNGWAE